MSNDASGSCPGSARFKRAADRDRPHGTIDLDVSWLVPADLDAVDTLARLQVAASRRGRRLRLHGVDGGLAELLEFVGLHQVVHLCPSCGSSRRRAGEPPT
jgi:hypothetical protein